MRDHRFLADVRRSTFQPRADLYILYTVVDEMNAEVGPVLLVPSEERARKDKGKKAIRFQINVRPTGRGQWDKYFINRSDLSSKILSILADLQRGGR